MADSDKGKWTNFFAKHYDPDKGTFCGRNGFEWLFLVLFYLAFYLVLAGFIAALIAIFFETVEQTEPKWFGTESLTQNNPGIGMRPLPQYDSTLIRFRQGKASTFKPYTDHLEAFLLQYGPKLQVGRDIMDCSVSEGFTKSDKKCCRFDLDKVLGPCTVQKDFGYEDGQPCILFKINKIYGFRPIPYPTLEQLKLDNDLKDTPRFLAFTANLTVGISCDGESAADRENIQQIEFYPRPGMPDASYSGIPVVSFPYLNQEGYRSPFIMAKFTSFSQRVLIQVVCTLYAQNIDNSGTARRYGTIRFELLKD